jgi:probable addiction module antidote protein
MEDIMSANKKTSTLVPFDAAHYLTDEASIAAYLDAVLESDDPDLLLLALGDVARARGMTDVARKSGLGRESLYKALTPGAQPRLPTVMKVLNALGLRLRVQPLNGRPTQTI